MDSRTRRSSANTVTVPTNTSPPSHIPKAALVLSLIAAIIAVVTQFTRSPIPRPSILDQPPTANISSISDLIQTVFDAPKRGHFFRTGCLSSRSLLCHTLQDVSYVLDAVDVSDDGESYVFRITKHEVHSMRRHILLRRERWDGCTPWHHGSFFMKLDWFLLYYLPRSIATTFFGNSFTEGGFRRDRWGWCAETIPFGTHRDHHTSFDGNTESSGYMSTSYAPKDDFSKRPAENHPKDNQEEGTGFPQSPNPAPQQGNMYRTDPVNQEAHVRQNVMYAR